MKSLITRMNNLTKLMRIILIVLVMALAACSKAQVQSALCNATEADMITCSKIREKSKLRGD